MTEFKTLGLDKRLLKNLSRLNIETPTPIQARGIPTIMDGRDIMGLAQTGTGKTAAFALPIIHTMLQDGGRPLPHHCKALILSPTRELANQIGENITEYIKYTPLKTMTVVGGQPYHIQKKKLAQGTDILVATPGRLLDLIDRGAVVLEMTHYLVLDEADQMLDLGFIEPLKQIAKLVSPNRQTLLFSATMPKQMNELANTYLNRPIRLEVSAPGKAADKVKQSVHFVNQRGKTTLLKKCLNENPDDISLVFVRTKRAADKLSRHLNETGYKADAIHGDKRQRERDRAIKKFKRGDINILIATDVAARGIDIPSVSHVYNYDLPEQIDNYVHRIGRTARAGREGDAVAFCSPSEVPDLQAIEKLMKIRIEIASGSPPEQDEIDADLEARGPRRGGPRRGGPRRGGPKRGGAKRGGSRRGDPRSGHESDHQSGARAGKKRSRSEMSDETHNQTGFRERRRAKAASEGKEKGSVKGKGKRPDHQRQSKDGYDPINRDQENSDRQSSRRGSAPSDKALNATRKAGEKFIKSKDHSDYRKDKDKTGKKSKPTVHRKGGRPKNEGQPSEGRTVSRAGQKSRPSSRSQNPKSGGHYRPKRRT